MQNRVVRDKIGDIVGRRGAQANCCASGILQMNLTQVRSVPDKKRSQLILAELKIRGQEERIDDSQKLLYG